MRPRLDTAVVRLLGFAGALAATIALVVWGRAIFTPVLLGLAIAYVFDPIVSWFERRGHSRLLGIFALAALLVVVAGAILLWAIPVLGDQASDLRANLPQYKARIEREVMPRLEEIQRRYPEQFELFRAKLAETLRERAPQIAESVFTWIGGVFGSAISFLAFLLDLVFVPVFAFYLLVDFPKLRRGVRDLVPRPYRAVVFAWLGEVDVAISGFVRGQLTIALILGVLDGVGLTLVGVPLGLGVGFAAGLANVIPYMALVLGLPVALVLAWLKYQTAGALLLVAAVMFGVQIFEGTWLTPRILGRKLHLHPVWVLLAVSAGGKLFGVVGMLVAVPTAAAIQVFVRHWIAAYERSTVYLGDAGAPAPAGGAPGEAPAAKAPAPAEEPPRQP